MDVLQLVSNLGYPITSAIAMLVALKYCYDKESAKAEKMHDDDCERLDKTIDKLSDITLAVKDNSNAILALVDEVREQNKED